jgi:hypothetical protein
MNDDPTTPAGPDPAVVFAGAAKLLHSGKYTKREIDDWIGKKMPALVPTDSQPTRFHALADLVQHKQNLSLANEQQQMQPGAVGSFLTHFGNEAGLGLPSRLGGQDVRDYMQAGDAAHPWASAAGDVGGGAAGGVVAGEGAGSLMKMLPFLKYMGPIARGFVTGAGTGAAVGELSGIGNSDRNGVDFLKHLPGEAVSALPSAGFGALLGGAAGGSAARLAEKINPTPGLLYAAIREGAPIEEGITTKASTRAGLDALNKLAQKSEQLAKIDPVLRRPMAFINKNFRTLAVQSGKWSPTAGEQGVKLASDIAEKVQSRISDIANHPSKGYDALFEAADANLKANPAVQAVARELGLTDISGRVLEDNKQLLSSKVRGMKAAKAAGNEINDADYIERTKLLQKITDALKKNVPGYTELTERLKPYMQYREVLNKFVTELTRARPRMMRMEGSGSGLAGLSGPGELIKDASSEMLGSTPMMRRAQTGRTLLPALLEEYTPEKLMERGELQGPMTLQASHAGGLLPGGVLAGLRRNKTMHGLLSGVE